MLPRTILILLAICSTALAADTKPSEESIRQLLTVTESRKLLDAVMTQMDSAMKAGVTQALRGQPITPEQQRIMDRLQAKTITLLKEELSWEKMEPVYQQIYRDSFTQEEVDGMLAFYKSAAGQALIKKMPMVLQRSMNEMQGRMGPLMQKIQAMTEDTVKELEAERTKQTDATPLPPPTPRL